MEHLFAIQYAWLIPLLPLIGAAIAGFFGARWLKGNSHWPIWIGVGLSAVLSLSLLIGMLGLWHPGTHEAAAATEPATESAETQTTPLAYNRVLFDWISAGEMITVPAYDEAGKPRLGEDGKPLTKQVSKFNAEAGFFFDPLTAVMLCVVTGIGFFITVFAAGYMKGEAGYFRFFAYLGLFIFMMCCLVMGNNLIMLYLGWEGVGLCSYLLIGYYYEKPSAREAAKKAFLVNRVGDFGFGLGIMLCFLAFGTVSYFGSGVGTNSGLLELAQTMTHNLTPFQRQAMQWIPFLLMMGAFGKSAQFPLHVWLPDAMEGPTPVSALIHAATMVTAGVYMIVRCGTLFVTNGGAMWTITVIGCFTALFAGSIALRQFDLKKVFAYSTVSQLGFMFVGVGALAPVAGVFHLVTHAFFKALLFLSSGVVMHAMAGELDLRKMSGLKSVLPKTRWLMLIGCLALAGAPPLAGFWSKDEIIVAAYTQSRLLAALMLLAAFMTAYYTFRLYFRVFEGPLVVPPPPPAQAPEVDEHLGHDAAHHGSASHDAHGHDEHHAHDHEPGIMIFPLIVLAFGAIVAGAALGWSEHRGLGAFLGESPSFRYAFLRAAVDRNPPARPLFFGQIKVHEEWLNPNNPDPAVKAYKEIAEADHLVHIRMMVISSIVALLGIYIAYLFHLRDREAGERLAARFAGVTRVLEAKFWIDEVYQKGIVEPLRTFGRFLYSIVDVWVIDGLVYVVSFVPQAAGFVLKFLTQRGYLQGYAVTMLIGIAVILLIVLL
jgi:NADH-quinone oxidoreductase subunit L